VHQLEIKVLKCWTISLTWNAFAGIPDYTCRFASKRFPPENSLPSDTKLSVCWHILQWTHQICM